MGNYKWCTIDSNRQRKYDVCFQVRLAREIDVFCFRFGEYLSHSPESVVLSQEHSTESVVIYCFFCSLQSGFSFLPVRRCVKAKCVFMANPRCHSPLKDILGVGDIGSRSIGSSVWLSVCSALFSRNECKNTCSTKLEVNRQEHQLLQS